MGRQDSTWRMPLREKESKSRTPGSYSKKEVLSLDTVKEDDWDHIELTVFTNTMYIRASSILLGRQHTGHHLAIGLFDFSISNNHDAIRSVK